MTTVRRGARNRAAPGAGALFVHFALRVFSYIAPVSKSESKFFFSRYGRKNGSAGKLSVRVGGLGEKNPEKSVGSGERRGPAVAGARLAFFPI